VLVKDVQEGPRGPEILLSRADPTFVKELFALEVPEIQTGVVKIEGIVREPGQRTKMAVSSSEEKIDPVGSCVGQRGIRVQAVTHELGEEKVDIIPFSHDTVTFIASALSPAKVIKVDLKKKAHTAEVEVPEDQLSLAIGKEGRNVRLAANLTDWRIDIKGAGKLFAEGTSQLGGEGLPFGGLAISKRTVNVLSKVGVSDIAALKEKSEEDLKAVKGLGPKAIEEIKGALKKLPSEDSSQKKDKPPSPEKGDSQKKDKASEE
jgi:transcription antitermination factor NusA-like protein